MRKTQINLARSTNVGRACIYNNAWKDQLTSYDNKAITYDASGNPISYMGKTLTWSRGRLLTKYVISPLYSISMQYDANGIRCSKTKFAAGPTLVGAYTTTNYTYDSEGRLRYESDGTFTRYYIYGADGIVGYEENGVQFMYRKNLFGDITAIYNGKTKVAEYVYDAWGNCTVTTNVNGYGTRNPIRYRGYYFDTDLNMYYLMTRYYDPQIGRFINADTPEYLKPTKINGLNLYAYCGNNPVMYVDPSGHEIIALQIAALVLYTALLATLVVVEIVLITDLIIDSIKNNQKPVDKEDSSPNNSELIEATVESAPEIASNVDKIFFPSNSSTKPFGLFGGSFGGDSLWDPVLQAILNESFTGSFGK